MKVQPLQDLGYAGSRSTLPSGGARHQTLSWHHGIKTYYALGMLCRPPWDCMRRFVDFRAYMSLKLTWFRIQVCGQVLAK